MTHDLFAQQCGVSHQMPLAGAGWWPAGLIEGPGWGTYQTRESKRLASAFQNPVGRHPSHAGFTATLERPTDTPAKEKVEHIFHANCNRDKDPQIAYCGYKGHINGQSWYPEIASSKDCTMCITARAMDGCPVCGYKPGK